MSARIAPTRAIAALLVLLAGSVSCGGAGAQAPDPPPSVEPAVTTSDTVSVWLTAPDRSALLAHRSPIGFSPNTGANTGPTITVDGAQTYQTMDGFGFALTGSSALVIHRMPDAARAPLLRELFGRDDASLGISYLRLTIGASDLSPASFTYDEVPAGQTDTALASFSIAAEQAHLVPLLKEILAINPNVTLLGSPWTAPRWMKDNASYIGGSLLPQYYQAYANYFVKYIQAMKAEGITIAAITPQNEPLNPSNEPSLVMTAAQQAQFIKCCLGPALRAAGLSTKIFVYDHNADHPEYARAILDDPAASAFVDGSAFHLYAGPVEALTAVHDAHPEKNLYFTEQYTPSNGQFAGDLRWHLRNIIIGAPANWARVALEWNLANDEKFGPHTPGGCTTCLGAVTIDSASSNVTRNVGYYILGHASRFVPPGSVRVASTLSGATGLFQVAYRTPAGRYVLVVLNDGNAPQQLNIVYSGKRAAHILGVGEAATYVW